MILVQASINLFAVLGLAPLTGVPLPFVSYGNSSLLVTLASVGLLLNIARGGRAPAKPRVAEDTRTCCETARRRRRRRGDPGTPHDSSKELSWRQRS